MSWHPLVVSGLVVLGAAGCESARPVLSADALTLAAADPSTVARAQQPETESAKKAPPGSYLNTAPRHEEESDGGQVAASIRATVNSVAILDEEVRDASYPHLMQTRDLPKEERDAQRVAIFTRELTRLVERELILQDAYERLKGPAKKFLDKLKEAAGKEFDRQVRTMKTASKAKTDDELKEFLRLQGLSLDGMRRQFERSFMAAQYIRSRMEPMADYASRPERVEEYYEQHPEEFQSLDSVQWQDIYVAAGRYPDRAAARQFAEQLAQAAAAGQDFAKLATQYDDGDSKYRNGEGYGHRHGEIRPPEAEGILFDLRDGQVGPLVELANGYHVIRLVKRDYAGRMALDEKVQTRIRDKLKEEAMNREYKSFVAKLRAKATIQYSNMGPQ